MENGHLRDVTPSHGMGIRSQAWGSDLVRDFAMLLPVVPGTAVKGDTHRTQACTEPVPQRLAFATHLKVRARSADRLRLLSPPSMISGGYSLQAERIFFSDERKVSLHAEIT